MDFLSLSSEYESYQEYFSKTKNTMKHVSNFFINFHKSLNEFATSIENSLNEILSNFLSYDKNITHIKKFFTFFQLYEKHLLNLTSISKKVLIEIISPTDDFSSFLFGENRRNLEKLKKMIHNTNNQKQKYDRTKESYFESCKIAEKQEKKLLEEMNKSEKNEEGIQMQNNILTKLRVQSQEEYQKYKEVHQATNNLFNEYNKKYFIIINNLKDNEEKRINYLSFHIEKFLSILTEEKNSLNSVIESALTNNDIESKDQSLRVQLDEDMKFYKDRFNFVYKPNQRFLEEELLVYDIYRRKMEAIINSNKLLLRNINNKKGLMVSYLPISIISNTNNNLNNLNIPRETQDYLSKFSSINLEQNDLLVYKSMFDSNPLNINQKLFTNFESKIKNDAKFAQKIIDKIFTDYFRSPTIFYQFNNLEQFNRLAEVLLTASMNKEITNKLFELNYGIINISEKGFIIDENTKKRRYLCQVLGFKSNLFQNKKHWKNLLIHKIDKTLDNYLNIEIEKDGKYVKKENKKNKDEEYKNYVEQKMKEIKEKNIFNIIQDFIVHFPNFNLDMSISNDLVMNVGTQYGLSKEEIKYLVCYMNSNIYSVKSGFQEKIKNNRDLNSRFSKYYKDNYLLKTINNTNNYRLKKLLIILNSAFYYLNPKDYISIRAVNKFFYENSEKKIYKNIFIKSDKSPLKINLFNVNKHIGMWYHYLKYDDKKLNYKEILSNIKNNKNPNYHYQDPINMDVARTFCQTDQDKKREMLRNILLSLSETFPKVGYCQGMNHLCHFLLEVTNNNEEKSFNIFSAIISKTKYDEIVLNDFKLMKKFFYVFDRLVSIYLPDLFVTINKINRVSACFYISPWFITLFTYRFQQTQDKLLLRIVDMFVLDGWICIVRIGLMLLKFYQADLIKMKYEELLQSLISELKEKYAFFGNSNYDKFIELYQEMKIPKGLINNIENEYELLQNIGKTKNN